MSTPRARVRGSHSGRPIMRVLDLLGRRWALRLLWELRAGPLTFRSLRDACGGVSPTVLNTRLGEMKQLGVIESTDEGYALTTSGAALGRALKPIQRWADEWAETDA